MPDGVKDGFTVLPGTTTARMEQQSDDEFFHDAIGKV